MRRALPMLMLVACHEVTAPTVPDGIYDLVAVNGEPLPFSFGSTETTGPWFVRSTVELKSSGEYVIVVTDSIGRFHEANSGVETGTWARIAGDSIAFTSKTTGRESTRASYSGDGLIRHRLIHDFSYRRR